MKRLTCMWLVPLALLQFACQPSSIKMPDANTEKEQSATSGSKAYVLRSDEGEVLMDGQGRTTIIKVSPETGAAHLTMGLEHHPKGSGTIVHRHDRTEEILFVHRGSGKAIINGDTFHLKEGATLFIPPGTWHGIDNPDDSINILFTTTPQGLEKLFRGIGAPPGKPLKTLTPQQMDSIESVSDSKAKKNL